MTARALLEWAKGYQTTCMAPACSRRTALVVLWADGRARASFCRGHRHRAKELDAVTETLDVSKRK